jgi:sterol desaturase/sphingolipid hydroxylase (fatty acid hydroxylase superfamily)
LRCPLLCPGCAEGRLAESSSSCRRRRRRLYFTAMPTFRYAVTAGSLALILVLERFFPLFAGRKQLLRHGVRNLAHAVVNALFGIAVVGAVHGALWTRMEAHRLGLLYRLGLPPWLHGLAVLLLFDLWMYIWHRLNHMVPFFWRFHRVHHSDPAMDVTTALRFHVGEIALSACFRLAIYPLLGMRAVDVLLYEVVMYPIIFLHHSNYFLPARWDRLLRLVVCSPRMHWVHHSRVRRETDSNYGAIFSCWDRLFRSFRLREDPRTIRYGLARYDEPAYQSVWGMLKTPFVSAGSKNTADADSE